MEIDNLAGKWPNVAINPATGKTYGREGGEAMSEPDTREKLEADVFYNSSCGCMDTIAFEVVIGWLDRQKAITEHECMDKLQDEIEYLRKVCQTQADSFAAIENENCALRSKLNRIRELAERLENA